MSLEERIDGRMRRLGTGLRRARSGAVIIAGAAAVATVWMVVTQRAWTVPLIVAFVALVIAAILHRSLTTHLPDLQRTWHRPPGQHPWRKKK